MRFALPDSKPLSPAELLELSVRCDAIVTRIERAKADFDSFSEETARRMAEHYKSPAYARLTMSERNRIASEETAARVMGKRAEMMDALNTAIKELGAVHETYSAQRPFWSTAVQAIERATLNSPKRATYSANLASAQPAAISNAAVQALMSGDVDLVAAIIARLDQMPLRERPFSAGDLAKRLRFEPYEKAAQALNAIDKRFQQGILVYRAAKAAKQAPLGRIALAVREDPFPIAEDGSIAVA